MSRLFNFDDFDELCAEALDGRYTVRREDFTRQELQQLATDQAEAERVLGHMVFSGEISIEEAYDLVDFEERGREWVPPGQIGGVAVKFDAPGAE